MIKHGRFVFYNNTKNFLRISFIFRCEIVKSKSARVALQIASFSWSIPALTIALNQSARETQTVIVKTCMVDPTSMREWREGSRHKFKKHNFLFHGSQSKKLRFHNERSYIDVIELA